MKIFKKLLLMLVVMLLPGIVSAATANFSISAAYQVVVGNNVTVTVTVSSSEPLGGWGFGLSYDKNYLQLSSAPDKAHGTNIAEAADSSKVKSKQYVFKFKALKSGSTTIQVVSSEAYGWNDEKDMTVSNGSKKLTLKTQAEIEASYSSDAYLKALGVTNYNITPAFDKKVMDYSLEVENDVEKVTITASKNDGNATVSGAGEKELKEGSNKFAIVVTAQKGNTLTYNLTITRKELNPIEVSADNKKQFIIRKVDDVPKVDSFVPTTIVYGEDEVPALFNEAINYTLIGLKDEEGNTALYIYKDGAIKDRYFEITTNTTTIIPKAINESVNDLKVSSVDIKGNTINGLKINDNSKQVFIKGINVINGEEATYLYDVEKSTFISANLDDLSFINDLNKTIKDYKLIIIVLGAIAFLLLILVIIKKPSKANEDKEEKKKEEKKEEVPQETKEVEEVKEEVVEPVQEEVVSKKSKSKKVKEEKQRLEIVEETEDDPLNHDDDCVDFWK